MTTELSVRGERTASAQSGSERPDIATFTLAEVDPDNPAVQISMRVHLRAGTFEVGNYFKSDNGKVVYRAEPGDLDFTRGGTITVRFFETQEDGTTKLIDPVSVSHAVQYRFAGRVGDQTKFRTMGRGSIVTLAPNFLPGSKKAQYYQALVKATGWKVPSDEVIAEFLKEGKEESADATEPTPELDTVNY